MKKAIYGLCLFLFILSIGPMMFLGNRLVEYVFGTRPMGDDLATVVVLFVVSLLGPCFTASWAAKAERAANPPRNEAETPPETGGPVSGESGEDTSK